jgi:hypothetical protein
MSTLNKLNSRENIKVRTSTNAEMQSTISACVQNGQAFYYLIRSTSAASFISSCYKTFQIVANEDYFFD